MLAVRNGAFSIFRAYFIQRGHTLTMSEFRGREEVHKV